MTNHTHQTAPTQYGEANRIRFAYRRFDKTGAVPLVFNMHFMGTMDHWDPAVTDGFAKEREVILFDNAGVSSSSGDVPGSFAEMGANAIAFIKAPGLKQVDVLGFKRFRLRSKDRDPEVTEQAALAQRAAIAKWGAKREHAWDYLKDIKQPTLIVNGSNDVIIYTINSYILEQNLPNAQLIIYPDSAHGSLYQYPELFVRHVSTFLSAADP
jgi:pimeloyl-ACP methyl ester carboxylesterase